MPGRKSDMGDSLWLRHLRSAGLLRASFRPEQHINAAPSLVRYRDSPMQLSVMHLRHMQQALGQAGVESNLQLRHVISDLGGTTGMAIVDAIPVGERARARANLRDPRIKASQETMPSR